MSQVFKKDDAGIRSLLKSDGCMKVMEKYAAMYSKGAEVRSFVGFDRAKCFVKKGTQK